MIVIYILCLLLLLGLILLLSLPFPKQVVAQLDKNPLVTILVAARNEEANIRDCINSLLDQNYPNIQLIVGDDESTDGTLAILDEFQRHHPAIEIYSQFDKLEGLNGKANVLAQIDRHAKGEILLFTDADTVANPDWARIMVSSFKDDMGIVTGMTVPETSFFQGIDWVYALIQVIKISALGVPTTSMGNNMGVLAEAYRKVGGYASVKNTLTEDYSLFHKIIGENYDYRFVFQKESLLMTKPVKGLMTLLYQRKRWMTGVIQLPFVVIAILLLLAAFYPTVIFILVKTPELGVLIWTLKIMLQTLIVGTSYSRLDLNVNPLKLLLYEFYSLFLTAGVLLFYILPIKVKWKGRTYG